MRGGPALAALAALLALAGCDKFEYLPDDPVPPITPIVLAHRGGGNVLPPGVHPNTLAAVRHGMSLLDGAEVDVQISADGTLWLGHDNKPVHRCDGTAVVDGDQRERCFQDLTDAEIRANAVCGEEVQYNTLAEVFAGVTDFPRKLLSLDIKGQYCFDTVTDAGIPALAQLMADRVASEVRAAGFEGQVMTESDQPAFLARIAEIGAPVSSTVVSLGDIDGPLAEAAGYGAAGISFKYADTSEPLTASVVAGIHQKGYRIAVWTINGVDDARAVWQMQPDVIETDDVDFFSYVADLAPPLPSP